MARRGASFQCPAPQAAAVCEALRDGQDLEDNRVFQSLNSRSQASSWESEIDFTKNVLGEVPLSALSSCGRFGKKCERIKCLCMLP